MIINLGEISEITEIIENLEIKNETEANVSMFEEMKSRPISAIKKKILSIKEFEEYSKQEGMDLPL